MAEAYTINGKPVSQPISSAVRQLIVHHSVLRQPDLRVGFDYKGRRSSNDEAWLAQMRGEQLPAADWCAHCRAGHGPFQTCVTIDGFFKGSCANCHYGSMGSRCSIRMGLENITAAITASHVDAPTIPGMVPPVNYGNSLSRSAQDGNPFTAVTSGPSNSAVLTAPVLATPTGCRRIAPTFVRPLDSAISHSSPRSMRYLEKLQEARQLSRAARRLHRKNLIEELAAYNDASDEEVES